MEEKDFDWNEFHVKEVYGEEYMEKEYYKQDISEDVFFEEIFPGQDFPGQENMIPRDFYSTCGNQRAEIEKHEENVSETEDVLSALEKETILVQIKELDQILSIIKIGFVIAAIAYYTTGVSRAKLICSLDKNQPYCNRLPDTCNLRSAANITNIFLFIMLFNISNNGYEREKSAFSRRNKMSATLVLIAELLRFINIREECGPLIKC